MKMTQIALAVAMVATTAVASAAPVNTTDIGNARRDGLLDQTWISGASAQAQVIYAGFSATCDANTQSIFTSDASSATTPGSLGNFVAYACTSGGRTKVVYHTMDGGSFNAYAPHTNGLKLDRLKELTANSFTLAGTFTTGGSTANVYHAGSRAGVGYVSATGAVTGYNDSLAPTIPAGGFSDVESKLFGSQLNNDPTTVGTETPVGLTQGFGVVVNTTFYRTLQVNQGIFADIATATANDATFSPANAPNITSAQYASIVSGSYKKDWAPLLPVASGTSPGAGKAIYVARRVDTSGTQAASNAFFLKNPCSGDPAISGLLAPKKATVASNTASGFTTTTPLASGLVVFAGAGTTDVKVALNAAETATKVVGGVATSSPNFAIGVVSLENAPSSETNAARKDYHYVKLDGIHPELGDTTYARAQLVSAAYQFQYESQSFIANTADAYGATLIGDIITQISTSTNCSTDPISRGLALTSGSASSVPASCVATQVAKGTRSGNSCQAIQLF